MYTNEKMKIMTETLATMVSPCDKLSLVYVKLCIDSWWNLLTEGGWGGWGGCFDSLRTRTGAEERRTSLPPS